MNKQRMALLLAAIVGIAATFLPWATVLGMTIDGTVGDGWISLGLFAIIIILAVLGDRGLSLKGGQFIAVVVLALCATALGVYEIMNLNKSGGEYVQIGFGLYVLVAAGAACLLLPFLLRGAKV